MTTPPTRQAEQPQARQTMGGKPVHHVPARSVINFTSGFAHKLLCDGLTFTTGSAHAQIYGHGDKLRFLQYVTRDTREWWSARQKEGAILL